VNKQLILGVILIFIVTLAGCGGKNSAEAEKIPMTNVSANSTSGSAVSNIPGNTAASNAAPSRRDADDVRSNAVSSNSNRTNKDRDDLNKRDNDRDDDDH
jgi:hypothetical protein